MTNLKNKEKSNVTILPSAIFIAGLLFTLFLALGIGLFTLIYDLYSPGKKQLDTITWCIIGFFCGVCPILLIIVGARRGLSVIRINENGIKLSAYGFIKLLEMQWDNIAEIRYYERFIPFIFISKTKTLENKTYDYIIRQRDVIQIQLNKKVYTVLSKYIRQPIIGLTEEKLELLKLK